MNVKEQIKEYIASQSDTKRSDMLELQKLVLRISPKTKLWFLDGKDENGKFVTNPNVGFGSYTIKYANGTSREFYRVGFTGNTAGISVYIMGLEDKKYLVNTYAKTIGKASVTGYCIKFKALKDINISVLEDAIRFGIQANDE